MKKQLTNLVVWGIVLVLVLSACGSETVPTPDASAIATSAVQTVEARYTEQAATEQAQATPTFTPELVLDEVTATPEPTPTVAASSGGSEAACYFAQFVGDITVPDGTIVLPGTTFTKTWQVKNVGSCAWDTSHRLYLQSGESMTTTTSIPLPQTVWPGQTINLSVPMTAPEAEGVYTGYWRIATPYGGSFGVNANDASLYVRVTVAKNPAAAFAVTNVFYSLSRDPAQGCKDGGARYTVTATVVTNGPGTVRYLWYQHPYDGGIREGGRLTFTEAGRKTISWTWILKANAVQDPNFERKVSLYVVEPNDREFREGWIPFYHTCP
jgi:hypothetical protein